MVNEHRDQRQSHIWVIRDELYAEAKVYFAPRPQVVLYLSIPSWSW